MAGNPQTKERLRLAEEEIIKLRAEIATYQNEGRAKRLNHRSRSYDESILDDLMEWSTEGQFLDEIVAQWGISRETFDEWVNNNPALAELLPIARSRSRASMLRHMRSALSSRSAFPAALADRIINMLDREAASGGELEASGLVHVNGREREVDHGGGIHIHGNGACESIPFEQPEKMSSERSAGDGTHARNVG